jgi:Histidine kinase-like ATPase domain
MNGGTGAVPAARTGVLPAALEPRSAVGSVNRTELELAALPTAPACARGHVRSVAHEWGLAALADTAELLASELVTNSVQAYERLKPEADPAAVPIVRLWVSSDRASLVIHVCDGIDEIPVRQDAGPDEISGRGLLLVETLAKDWGTYRQASGKIVWVLISLPGDP